MNLSELVEKIIFGHPCSIANVSRLMTKKIEYLDPSSWFRPTKG